MANPILSHNWWKRFQSFFIHLHDLYGTFFWHCLNEQMKLVVQGHAIQHNITLFVKRGPIVLSIVKWSFKAWLGNA
jgi:hypothetical protein